MEVVSLSEIQLKFQIQLNYFNIKQKLDALPKMAMQKDFPPVAAHFFQIGIVGQMNHPQNVHPSGCRGKLWVSVV